MIRPCPPRRAAMAAFVLFASFVPAMLRAQVAGAGRFELSGDYLVEVDGRPSPAPSRRKRGISGTVACTDAQTSHTSNSHAARLAIPARPSFPDDPLRHRRNGPLHAQAGYLRGPSP